MSLIEILGLALLVAVLLALCSPALRRRTLLAAGLAALLFVTGASSALAFRGDYPPAPPVTGCNPAVDTTCTSPVRDPAPANPTPPATSPPVCDPLYGRHC